MRLKHQQDSNGKIRRRYIDRLEKEGIDYACGADSMNYATVILRDLGQIGHPRPYCDTADITPIKSDIPGAPDICPVCGGWL